LLTEIYREKRAKILVYLAMIRISLFYQQICFFERITIAENKKTALSSLWKKEFLVKLRSNETTIFCSTQHKIASIFHKLNLCFWRYPSVFNGIFDGLIFTDLLIPVLYLLYQVALWRWRTQLHFVEMKACWLHFL